MTQAHPSTDVVSSGATDKLARFVSESRLEDLPAAVLHEAKRTLLNHFAAGFGGCREGAIETLLSVLVPLSGPATGQLTGRAERLDMLGAAFMNAVSSNVQDYDDTHMRTIIHPAAPIAPPLLALAQSKSAAGQPISGRDLLHALVLGVDVTCRVGNAMSPGHYARGWHITGTCGVLGAAAAAGKLLGLDTRRMTWALGSAATQAAGLVETLGFDAKSLNVGNAARGGLLAALLANKGFAGPTRPIEGQRGYLAVMSSDPDISALLDGLGRSYEISLNTYKLYPCGIVLHPVIDACLELRTRPGVRADAIKRVVVRGHPLLRQRTDRPRVSTGREAQVCLRHTVGVSLIDGAAGVAQYTDAKVADDTIRALGDRVVVEEDTSIPVEAARVTVDLVSGVSETAYIAHARGSLGRPLSDAEIEDKLQTLACLNAPACAVDRLIEAVWGLDQSPDAGKLMPLAALP
jgi:2-methylcitrate dehydratase PrpD